MYNFNHIMAYYLYRHLMYGPAEAWPRARARVDYAEYHYYKNLSE